MANATVSAIDLFHQMEENAANCKPETIRISPVVSAKEFVRQGDVYFRYLESLPSDVEEMKDVPLQLAEGETRGSRHTLENASGVRMFKRKEAGPLQGPIIQILVDEKLVVHPDHGTVILENSRGGCYEVGYQRDPESEQLARVRD